MNARTILLAFFLLLCRLPSSSLAQTFQIRHYGTAQGLPQSEIIDVYQDRQGYLWFGTYENGAARYDGRQMKRFSVTEGLGHASIRDILQDRFENIWIATENGLACITPDETVFNFNVPDGLPSNEIFSLAEDGAGNLWIGTGAGLCRSAVQQTNSSKPELALTVFDNTRNSKIIRAIAVSREQQVLAGTDDGLYRVHGDSLTVPTEFEKLQNHFIRRLFYAQNGVLWIGAAEGLYRLADNQVVLFSQRLGMTDENIYALAEDQSSNLWIGTRSGLLKYDGQSLTTFDTRDGLPSNFVRALCVDYENNIWIGTLGAGAAKIFGWHVQNYTRQQGLPANVVFSFLQDRAGRMWIGTSGGGLAIVQGNSVEVLNSDNALPDNFVHGLAQSAEGDIWVATNGGAARQRNGRWQHFTARDGLPSENLRSVFCAPNGEVWFGTFNGGAIVYRNERFAAMTTNDSLPHISVSQIYQDRQGRLWIATDGGIYMRDQNQQTHIFDQMDNLQSPAIYCIYEDQAGDMWFGTRFGGALRYAGDEFEVYDENDGLPSKTIYFIAEDQQRRMWLGTNDGVAYFHSPNFFYFDAAAGLADNECNTRAVMRDREGWMWFGTIGGASRVNVAAVPFTAAPPRVDILALETKHESYRNFADLRLPANTANEINFKFGALSFINENANTNLVKLEGFDDEWKNLGAEHEIRYTNLAPKQYTLWVRGVNAYGQASSDTAKVSFEVLPAFYQTAWFYAGCALLLLGLGYGIFRLRMRQARARERELEKAVAEKTERLQETHSFLATVKESLPIGLLVLDAKGIIVDNNRAAQELFGFAASDLRGRELHSLLSSPLMKRDAVWETLAGQKAEIDLVGMHKDGHRFVCQIHSDHVNDGNGRLQFLILTCENIDERKQLEAKLIENEKQLAMVDLMAGMGDVLNNKLSGIQGYIDILKTELASLANQESARAIAWVQGSIHDMSKVIRQLIDCSAYLVKQAVVATDLRQELRRLEQHWNDKIKFRITPMPSPIPVEVISKFRNGLDEAVVNAIEAEATQINIEVETLPAVSRVRVLMTDNGRGISPENITKVFLPFFKTKSTPHSGLGLWKLYQVIKQCGGAAEVVALPNGGTQLRLTLPLHASGNGNAGFAEKTMRMLEEL